MKRLRLKRKDGPDRVGRGCYVEYLDGVKYFSTVTQAIKFVESNWGSNLEPFTITDATTYKDISFILNKEP